MYIYTYIYIYNYIYIYTYVVLYYTVLQYSITSQHRGIIQYNPKPQRRTGEMGRDKYTVVYYVRLCSTILCYNML